MKYQIVCFFSRIQLENLCMDYDYCSKMTSAEYKHFLERYSKTFLGAEEIVSCIQEIIQYSNLEDSLKKYGKRAVFELVSSKVTSRIYTLLTEIRDF